MSRYDRIDSEQLRTSATAMNELAQQWEISGQTGAASAIHGQINEVLDELENRGDLS